MKPKCAWIDRCLEINTFFALELRKRGIHLDTDTSLERFQNRFNLEDYPILLYHPEVREQYNVQKIIKQYPNTKVALITAPHSGTDYEEVDSEILVFTYHPDSVEKFIRDNQ